MNVERCAHYNTGNRDILFFAYLITPLPTCPFLTTVGPPLL